MKHKKTICIVVIIFLICTIFIVCYIERRNTETTEEVKINEGLSNITSFSVSSESSDVNSSINGTVFFYNADEGGCHAQIVANFEIDPNDWGGIEFYFPEGMLISNIDSSYPQEIPLHEKTHNGFMIILISFIPAKANHV